MLIKFVINKTSNRWVNTKNTNNYPYKQKWWIKKILVSNKFSNHKIIEGSFVEKFTLRSTTREKFLVWLCNIHIFKINITVFQL